MKYWTTVGNDNWVFGCKYKENTFELIKHPQTSITRHTKVKSECSPYDGNTIYWAKRMKKHPELKDSVAKMLHKQDGKCNWCGLPFQEDDVIEDDHIIARKAGGNNSLGNRALFKPGL